MNDTFIPHAPASRAKRFRSAAAILFLALNGGAAILPPERLLPDDTLIVVTMPDVAKVREIYTTSPQMQLWNDPAMKPFKDKFLSKLQDELVRPLERDLGIQFQDYTNLAQGQLTFAMTQNGWQPGSGKDSPGLLFLLDAKDKGGQLKTNLATLRRKWLDSGKSIRTEKIRDIEFSVLPVSEKDIPQSLKKILQADGDEDQPDDSETNKTPKNEWVIGQFESLLVIGNSMKPVEKVVVHLTGGSMPSLGDLAAYEADRLAMFRDAPFYGWANVKLFVDLITRKSAARENEADNPFAIFNPEKLLAATGLGSVKTISFNVRNSADGMLVQFFAGVPEASRQGLLKIFPGEAKESGPPPFVPADTVKFERWRIDGQKAWATLQKMLNDISPQLLKSVNSILEVANSAEQEKNPDFDVKKNLFGNLGDDIISYQKMVRGNKPADLESPPSLLLIGSPHPDQLAAALRSILVLFNRQGGTPTDREFLGRKIYSLPWQSPALPGGNSPDAPGRTLSYAAGGSYVAISSDASMLEEYLRSSDAPQKALRETPGLVDATAKVGGSSSGFFGYENQVETTRTLFEALRKNTSPPAASNGAPGIPAWNPESGLKEWMDFSLLPPFEKIAKYFCFTVYSGSASVDGLSFKLFAPIPPSLKK